MRFKSSVAKGVLKMIAMMVSLMAIGCQCAPPTVSAEAPAGRDSALTRLGWLAGSWVSESAANGSTVASEEHWTQPAGGTMLGMNRTVVIGAGEPEGKTVFFEYLRIEQTASGIVYLASPKGRQPPTPFSLVAVDADMRQRAVFENLEHDYPQRIIYERKGEMLRGRIEGEVNGALKSDEWTWRRSGS